MSNTHIVLKPAPCPACGSGNIGVKDTIIVTAEKELVRKVWAYCRNCEHKGPEFIFCENDDDKEISEAFERWDRAIIGKG